MTHGGSESTRVIRAVLRRVDRTWFLETHDGVREDPMDVRHRRGQESATGRLGLRPATDDCRRGIQPRRRAPASVGGDT